MTFKHFYTRPHWQKVTRLSLSGDKQSNFVQTPTHTLSLSHTHTHARTHAHTHTPAERLVSKENPIAKAVAQVTRTSPEGQSSSVFKEALCYHDNRIPATYEVRLVMGFLKARSTAVGKSHADC